VSGEGDGEAAAGRGEAGRLHGWRADDGRAIRQGRLRLPDVDRRAAPRGQKARRHTGVHFPDRAVGAPLLHQEEGVARRGIASGEAQAAFAERISARVSEPLVALTLAPRSKPAARCEANRAIATWPNLDRRESS